MNLKRAVIVLLAVALMPGLAWAQDGSRATFTVGKRYPGSLNILGNPVPDVTLKMSCNTGIPLDQTKTVEVNAVDFEVEFVVTDFDQGELDCTISEEPVEGYNTSYACETFLGGTCDTGDSVSFPPPWVIGDEGPCVFEDIDTSGATGDEQFQNGCVIRNYPQPIEIAVQKNWVFEGDNLNGVDTSYQVRIACLNGYMVDQNANNQGALVPRSSITYYADGTSDQEFTAHVIPALSGNAICNVQETPNDSTVEVESDCGTFVIEANGADAGCTVTNTLFFEGIPALGSNGKIILALLMLGVGFVGFRRFA